MRESFTFYHRHFLQVWYENWALSVQETALRIPSSDALAKNHLRKICDDFQPGKKPEDVTSAFISQTYQDELRGRFCRWSMLRIAVHTSKAAGGAGSWIRQSRVTELQTDVRQKWRFPDLRDRLQSHLSDFASFRFIFSISVSRTSRIHSERSRSPHASSYAMRWLIVQTKGIRSLIFCDSVFFLRPGLAMDGCYLCTKRLSRTHKALRNVLHKAMQANTLHTAGTVAARCCRPLQQNSNRSHVMTPECRPGDWRGFSHGVNAMRELTRKIALWQSRPARRGFDARPCLLRSC
jgi:hypothetical protein